MLLGHDLINPNLDKRVYLEAKSLINSNYNVTIISWPRRLVPFKKKREIYNDINIVRVYQNIHDKRCNFFIKLPQYIRLVRKMVLEISEIKPSLLISHDLEMLPIGVCSKLLFSIPLIYDSHENWPAMEKNISIIVGHTTNFLEIICLIFVDHVFTISKSLERKFISKGMNTNVLYTSRPKKEITNLKVIPKDNIRKKLGYNNYDRIIGYFGELENKKIEILLETIEYLYTNYDIKNIKLLIIGGPKYEVHKLIQFSNQLNCEKHITILNYIKYDEIHNYFNILDIGVTQYNFSFQCQIAIPGKLLDYLAFGVPPISIRYYERAKIIQESKCGTVFDKANPKEIANAIVKILYYSDIKKLKANAITAFNEKFCWEIQEKSLINTIRKMLK